MVRACSQRSSVCVRFMMRGGGGGGGSKRSPRSVYVPDVDEVETLLLVVLVLVSVLNHSSTPIMEHQGQEAPDNIGQRGDRSGVRSRGSGIAHVRRRGRCREELKERKETAGGRGGEGTSKSDTNIDTQTRT